jgi:hypothetical protein
MMRVGRNGDGRDRLGSSLFFSPYRTAVFFFFSAGFSFSGRPLLFAVPIGDGLMVMAW